MAGGYLAQYNRQYVFIASLLLTVVDLVYIYLFLPESRDLEAHSNNNKNASNRSSNASDVASFISDHNISWNPWDTVRVVAIDPFLRKVGQVAFLYYTR